ncbi:hypothetical protein FI667_g8009, partial [Globisporangium splendens]
MKLLHGAAANGGCARRRKDSSQCQRTAAHAKQQTQPQRRVRLAHVVVSLVALLAPQFVDAQLCAPHFEKDELLARLDTHFGRCVDEHEHHDALEIVKDRFATNEYARQQPLAMVLFSNSTPTLHAFTGAIVSALFGDALASFPYAAVGRNVQVLDFAQLLEQHQDGDTNYDVKNAVRRALSASLSACPDRNLFIMENMQVLDDATLPVLDTFLDPMNGVRAHFQQHNSGGTTELLDCTNAVFLFHFHVDTAFDPHSPPQAWRDFLMARWTRKIGLVEEFTPQAFVGRLTEGVALFARNDDHREAHSASGDGAHDDTRQWRRTCLPHKSMAQAEREGSDGEGGGSAGFLWTFIQSQWLFLCIILAFLLLNHTKLFTRNAAYKRARHTMEPIVGKPLSMLQVRDDDADDLLVSNGHYAPQILEAAATNTQVNQAIGGDQEHPQEQLEQRIEATEVRAEVRNRTISTNARGIKSPKVAMKKSIKGKGSATKMQLRSKKSKR